MSTIEAAYRHLMERIAAWAQGEDNIRAALIIGSRARQDDHPADEWSDLDVILLARDPRPYWQTSDWLSQIGSVWLSFVEEIPDGGGFERRVLFEGGLEVDFAPDALAGVEEMLHGGFPPLMADILRRGVRFLVDKEGLAARFAGAALPARPTANPPAPAEFLNLVNDFWYHTVWTAKHLRRGELWWAKSCCDGRLKGALLKLLQWHAQARRGPVDAWMRGRFLEEWADRRAVAALPRAFAHYDAEDVWRALRATMELFDWLERETATAWGYVYPTEGAAQTRALAETLYAGRGAHP